MVNKQFHFARTFTGLSAVLALALAGGCASTPDEPPAPVPVEEPVAVAQPQPQAEPETAIELRPDYPETYTVVKGDTLWDISSSFLKDPWMWPELWQVNPQIANPHLIYPGDVLTIYFIDGKPMLRVDRQGIVSEVPGIPLEVSGKDYPTVKLEPRVRELGLDEAVPTIPLDAIRSFLIRPRVLNEGELEKQPYVVANSEERLLSGAGHSFYARGIKEEEAVPSYSLVRAGEKYVDPDSGEVLGYEALYLGEAQMTRYGDPAKLYATETKREILRGDRLMPSEDERLQYHYLPRPPEGEVSGKIIAAMDSVSQIGQYQVVVLNLGREDDMQPGHVLAAMQAGKTVKDSVAGGSVKLPDEKAGIVMVFRVFDRVSYALVMRATSALHLHDTVTNP